MSYEYIFGIPVWGSPDESAVAQALCTRKNGSVVHIALMADHHKGYGVPIGGVVAYQDAVSPSGVGYDIGCGNLAVKLDMKGDQLRPQIARVMDEIWSVISFGVGQKNNVIVDDELFDSDAWKLPAIAPLKEMARQQLGTIGSGNHYVDLFIDENDDVWIGVHFGSRGLGHKIATFFLKQAGAKDDMDAEPCVLSTKSTVGQDYLTAMWLAGRYAYAGREWVCSRVTKILGASIIDAVHNHHNYAWQETHMGQSLWVVRKGATPAFPGQRGFVGGTMTENAVILEGSKNPTAEQLLSLFSTVHGAGRAMGRRVAKRTLSQDSMNQDVLNAGIELRGAGLDESSFCYKRLPEVLQYHANTVNILHTLKPVGVAMAGSKEYDPFKD